MAEIKDELENKPGNYRRRVPRRNFECPVGVLLQGDYTIQRSFQVGEGGMMISAPKKLDVGVQIVTSFYLEGLQLIIVRGIVRNIMPAKGSLPERYGIEFTHLGSKYKREIRNFVSAATRLENQKAG